jgi:hypothetical protein
MSATLQTVKLVEYFSTVVQPAVIEMEGRMFPVQEYFLEHVLEMTGYVDATTADADGARLEAELARLKERQEEEQQSPAPQHDTLLQCVMCGKTGFADPIELGAHIVLCDGELSVGNDGVPPDTDGADFSQFADYEEDEFQEFEDCGVNGTTADDDDLLASFGDKKVTSSASVQAVNDGRMEREESKVVKWDGESPFNATIDTGEEPAEAEEKLLSQYQAMHDDEQIDIYLLLEVVRYTVNLSHGDGAILVFLPGWQEINEFQRLLETTSRFHDRTKYLILPLHSGIPSKDQRRVLQRPPEDVRKIVLSTNIAETSLTIEDVAFVIDSGRAKESSYDPHLKTSTLQSTWISQASAKQRKGRAGRTKTGVCFHLFSKRRHASMRPFTESELLRTPLVRIEKDRVIS